MPQKPYDTPAVATAEDGEVMLDGPDGLAISLTPQAAFKTAESIVRAAQVGDQQAKDMKSKADRSYG